MTFPIIIRQPVGEKELIAYADFGLSWQIASRICDNQQFTSPNEYFEYFIPYMCI